MTEKLDRRQFVRLGGATVAAGLGASLLAACGSSDDGGSSSAAGTSTTGAGIGGTLTAMAWNSYVNPDVAKPFLTEHGVEIENARLSTNEEIFTRLKSGGLGKVDMVTPNIAYVEQLVRADLLQPIDFSRLKNASRMLPQIKAVSDTVGTIDGQPYAVPFMWGFDGMVYNSSKLSEPPASWRELLDPKYEGKVLLPEGPNATFEIWPRVLGYDMATLTHEQLDEVTDFVIGLKKANVRTITGDIEDMASLLASGDIWVTGSGTWFGLPTVVAQKHRDTAVSLIPSDGGATWIDTYVIPKDAPNVDTAYAFIDHMLGAAEQAELVKVSNNATVNADAVAKVPRANKKLYGYSGEIGTGNVPTYQFPPAGQGYTTPTDWNDAWARIAAA